MPSKVQLFSAAALYAFIIVCICLPRRSGSDSTLIWIMWMLFAYFSVYVPKLLFVMVDLIASVPCLFKSHRIGAVSMVGGVLSIMCFLAMWWGALVNRYRIDVKELTVEIPGLPERFDGYKIVQFSDFHVGTYGNDDSYVRKVVDKINSLNCDLIVFTGDIVNRRTDELLPFVDALSGLEAPDGVYSILGNHDYGDYSDWDTAEDKARNMEMMYDLQADMGWHLLRNESDFLKIDNDSIAIVGVENVGDPPFKVYGSISKAYPSIDDDNVKILLTHNPAHWVNEIANGDANVALTLSGHTHAMQIELFGVSPAVWRYPTWGGLYEDDGKQHKLYVNIGIGTVGIPTRIGATPELTVITLKREQL